MKIWECTNAAVVILLCQYCSSIAASSVNISQCVIMALRQLWLASTCSSLSVAAAQIEADILQEAVHIMHVKEISTLGSCSFLPICKFWVCIPRWNNAESENSNFKGSLCRCGKVVQLCGTAIAENLLEPCETKLLECRDPITHCHLESNGKL